MPQVVLGIEAGITGDHWEETNPLDSWSSPTQRKVREAQNVELVLHPTHDHPDMPPFWRAVQVQPLSGEYAQVNYSRQTTFFLKHLHPCSYLACCTEEWQTSQVAHALLRNVSRWNRVRSTLTLLLWWRVRPEMSASLLFMADQLPFKVYYFLLVRSSVISSSRNVPAINAILFPCPLKVDTVPRPVKPWNITMVWDVSGPRLTAISWAAR